MLCNVICPKTAMPCLQPNTSRQYVLAYDRCVNSTGWFEQHRVVTYLCQPSDFAYFHATFITSLLGISPRTFVMSIYIFKYVCERPHICIFVRSLNVFLLHLWLLVAAKRALNNIYVNLVDK